MSDGEPTARSREPARHRVASGAQPDRTGAAAPRRLRLRRHPRSTRRRPDRSRPASRGSRCGARAGLSPPDGRRRDLGPSAPRPRDAVTPAERGAPRRQPRLGVRPRLHPTTRARAPRAPRQAPLGADRDRARAPGYAPRDEAGERGGARAWHRPRGRRARAGGGPLWPRDLAGRPRHEREGRDRAVVARDRQGRGGERAPRADVGQRRALPRGRRHRRERLHDSSTAPTSGSRSGRERRRPPTGSTSRSTPCACSGSCSRRGAPGSTASTRCRSSATRCSRTARRWRCWRPTPGSPGSAIHVPTRRRSSPTSSAARGPGTSRSRRPARESPSASATGRAR